MRILLHALIVTACFVSVDHYANDGRETARLIRKMDAQTAWHSVKAQNYQVAARVRQEVYDARPMLALVKFN